MADKLKYINTFTPLPWQEAPWRDTSPVLLLTGSAGGGKAIQLCQVVPTPLGYREMGDIQPGNYVLDENGKPIEVIAVSAVMYDKPCYEVEFDDGTRIVAAGDHLWQTSTVSSRASARNYQKTLDTMGDGSEYNLQLRGNDQHKRIRDSVVTTENIRDTLRTRKSGQRLNHAVDIALPLELPEKWLDIHPYVLGAWLGDGSKSDGTITSDTKDSQHTIGRIKSHGYTVRKHKAKYSWGIHNLIWKIRSYGILNNKRIPSIYLRASFDQRIALLQGLMDTDGHVGKNGRCSIDLSRLPLLEDVRELVCTLGIKPGRISESYVMCEGKRCVRYRMSFRTTLPVASMPRKAERIASVIRDTQSRRMIKSVVPVESVPVKCIQVNSESGLFLVSRSFIPTHNSKCAAEKLHGFCLRYPGATALVLRKERATMSGGTLLFLDREIIGNDPRVRHMKGSFRFEYANGSILGYGGMKDADQRERIRSYGQSGGIDICWLEEATQFTEEDFNEVIARMRGTAAPWRQIILTTNPDAPGHWINVRLIKNEKGAAVYRSSAADNTYNPGDYIDETLNRLSGVQFRRLVLGEWAAGAGRVIDKWVDEFNPSTGADNDGNVTLDAEYQPGNGRVIWSIDDGYSGKINANSRMFTAKSHPRAFLLAQIRQDGIIAIFGESLAIETLASTHIQRVIEHSVQNGWPIPHNVIRDRAAAALHGALKEAGFAPRYNQMLVEESVKELREWVAVDKNGVRRLIVHPRCFYTRYQMQTYSMNEDGGIIKAHDDTIDACRYLIFDRAYGTNPDIDIATWSSVEAIVAEKKEKLREMQKALV